MFLFYEINTIQTSDPVINCENDEDLILIDTKTLKDSQLSNNNSCLKTNGTNILNKENKTCAVVQNHIPK